MLEASLIAIILLVLILPITVNIVERNIELFLFVIGILAATCSHFLGSGKVWSLSLIQEALSAPLKITAAVLIFGVILFALRKQIEGHVCFVENLLGRKIFIFLVITLLGILSSFITAIMAAILLVEIISCLKYDRKLEIKIVILGCFSIGLGAALTPIGEPLSTILVAKLSGEPYNAGFFFLLKNAGVLIIPGILLFGVIGLFLRGSSDTVGGLHEKAKEKLREVLTRGAKVYIFIAGLIFLAEGFKPIINKYIIELPGKALFWINILSSVMDNATLTAAEISPKMSVIQIKYVLMGLLISGGMLIPGNIPNIICAGKLGIKSREWARFGVPLGFIVMVVYFVIFEMKIIG